MGRGVEFTSSADKHGVPHEDILWAVAHHSVRVAIPGRDGRPDATLFIGHPHPQTNRYLEVMLAMQAPRGVVVFHAMELTDKYRYLLNRKDT